MINEAKGGGTQRASEAEHDGAQRAKRLGAMALGAKVAKRDGTQRVDKVTYYGIKGQRGQA